MSSNVNYAKHADNPELIALCEHCQEADCDGLCRANMDKWRAIYNKPRTARRPKKEPRMLRLGSYKQALQAFGETHTLAEWGRIYDIPYDTLYQRLYRGGYTLEDAIRAGRRSGQTFIEPVLYEYDGKSMSISEWSEYTGVNKETIRARLRRGWSVGRAVTTPGWVNGQAKL